MAWTVLPGLGGHVYAGWKSWTAWLHDTGVDSVAVRGDLAVTAFAGIPPDAHRKFPTRVASLRRAGVIRCCRCLTPVALLTEARFLMLTWEDDVEVHGLRRRGWSISTIARHTGFDRKTVCRFLNGDGKPGVRARSSPDPFDPFVDYVTARLVEDPHLWTRALFDGLARVLAVVSEPDPQHPRPEPAPGLRGVSDGHRASERGHSASGWGQNPLGLAGIARPVRVLGLGKKAYLLVGSPAHSGKWRAALSSGPTADRPFMTPANRTISFTPAVRWPRVLRVLFNSCVQGPL
jgi:hypothetical protein